MKKFLILIAFTALSVKLFAQDCTQYVFMKKGRTIENTSYNAAGNMMHKAVMHVDNVTTVNGSTTANISAENFDQTGKSRSKNNVSYTCDNGTLNIDISAMMPQQGNFKFSTAYFKYPPGMKVGDHFDDVTMSMQMDMRGKTMKSTTVITDRTVVDKESLTTPAGTWNCLKMTYKLTTTMEGINMPPYSTVATEWYVPNFGIVQYQIGAMVTKITAIKD